MIKNVYIVYLYRIYADLKKNIAAHIDNKCNGLH